MKYRCSHRKYGITYERKSVGKIESFAHWKREGMGESNFDIC